MAGLAARGGEKVTSADVARSVNTSPSFVRRVMAKLSKAGLVETTTGPSGESRLARRPEKVSLLEIYHAVGAPKAFAIHDYEAMPACQVSCNIKSALEKVLDRTQDALEATLGQIKLSEVLSDMRRR